MRSVGKSLGDFTLWGTLQRNLSALAQIATKLTHLAVSCRFVPKPDLCSAKTGLMHRNKKRHFYSITSSVRASSMGGMVSLRPYAYGCALMSPRPSAQLKSIAVHLVPAH
jgi:hypothetical protein